MALDDDAEDDAPFGAPLPPDDRLWRHPSEMGSDGAKQHIVLVSKGGTSVARTILIALFASLVGAATTLAVVASTDAFVRENKSTSSVELREVPPLSPGQTELAIADKVLPAVARVEATGPSGVVNGTAVVFRSDGQLITTADLVDASKVVVYLNDGTKLDATVAGRSAEADISILKVDKTGLPVAVGTQRKVLFGDRTVMIDASKPTRGPEITVGVVTKESTEVTSQEKPTVYGLIQTTTRASVTPRSAGSLLIDTGGTVIGMITSRAEPAAAPTPSINGTKTVAGSLSTSQDEGNALHFATAADYAWDIAGQLADKGGVVKPWMGLRGIDIDREAANQMNIVGGMRITWIDSDSPSRAANLRQDDVVVAVDDDNVLSYNDFIVALRRKEPGAQVKITIIRNNEADTKLATVAGKPEL